MNKTINSSIKAYSVYNNLVRMTKELIEFDVEERVYCNCTEEYKLLFKRIYNDIENNYYGYREYIIFILYNLIFKNSVDLSGNMTKKIYKVMKLFTREQLEKDKNVILELNRKRRFGSDPERELFEIKEVGYSLVYKLIVTKKKNSDEKIISPIFFINYGKKFLTKQKKDIILSDDSFKDDNYKRFEFISNQILKYLDGGFYECKKIFV